MTQQFQFRYSLFAVRCSLPRYVVLASLLVASPISAQDTLSRALEPFAQPVVTVGEDKFRPLPLLRSTSSLTDPGLRDRDARPLTLFFPAAQLVANSELPFGQNDGALWAGRGTNLRLLGGLGISAGPLRLVVIPEITRSANRELTIDPTDPAFAPAIPENRSTFSSPFNVHPYSIDLPWRMGTGSFTEFHPGQSSITLSASSIQAGAATENEWWGPAIRNPLVMSDNAPGFPHLFLRTRGPVNTPVGRVDARWIVGGLEESDWFDNDETNDVRSISALALTWKRRESSPFTIGLTRAVFAPADGYGGALSSVFDVFRNTGHPNARAASDPTMIPGPDQISSLFAQAQIPSYGLETYIEWARADFPVSLRDFLEEPIHSRGYTAGVQWITPVSSQARFRAQGEVTSIEQSTTYRFRQQGSFYTSRAVIQGYTNRGQMLGSGLGPGSSGAWLAGDIITSGWHAGITWSRVRFNNDAFFLQPYATRCGHDVTVAPGGRAGYSNLRFRLDASLSFVSRYNTFFQNKNSCESGGNGSDRSSTHFTLTLAALGL
jgi:hypothetical protein